MKTKEQVQKEIEHGNILKNFKIMKGVTLKEFIEYVENDGFVPYDGIGYFHDGEKETNRSVWASDISLLELKKYPYVCWYNR